MCIPLSQFETHGPSTVGTNAIWKGPPTGGRMSNVVMRVPYNSAFTCRVEQVVFTGQYANERIAIATREDDYPDCGPTVPHFRFDCVAVENDSISDFYLSSFAGGQMPRNVRRLPSTSAAMDALASGEVMAAMSPASPAETWPLKRPCGTSSAIAGVRCQQMGTRSWRSFRLQTSLPFGG